MTKIKKDLWSKLHQVKSVMKDGVTQLAQIMQTGATAIAKRSNALMKAATPQTFSPPFTLMYYGKGFNYPQSAESHQPLFLSQTSSDESQKAETDNDKQRFGLNRRSLDTGVSSVKQMNTRGTLILYFCIMTVLIFCCLARCLIVPLS